MGPDLQSQILYILLPFEQDAKLSENGLVPIIRCDLNKGPLSDYAIVSDPDVSHQLRKGAGYLTTGRSEILAKVTGPYRYEIDPDRNDFGHIREVELLTPHGIANISKIVGSGLRSTLRNAGRTWCVRGRDAEFERVLAQADDPEVAKESTNNERVQGVMGDAIQAAIKAMRSDFDQHSADVLNNAEWEGIIANALKPLFPTSEVEKTGGPNENGADIQITTPNPFNGPDWITVIQVKDWQGKAGPKVIQQLEKAIKTRRNPDDNCRNTAHVISAVLTLGMAEPTPELEAAALDLERREGVPVTIIYGDQLLELIFSGTLQQTFL